MSELTRKLRARVDEIIEPHVTVYGPEAPVVKMALLVLAEAEAIEADMSEQKVSTERASELTGWSVETLQSRARRMLGGEEFSDSWAGLQVDKTSAGYAFSLGSIPENPRAAA